ncbi:AIR synthase related protein [Streptomyces avermitilis]|uniref:Thiamine-phosphate kinase n=1 Tax=Streptomyces avermitilis TaxID=33903 RepID=A0A4D4MHQ6_STRAX|nr:AIR synthase related protein [Streptomyces avermitilis]GDY68384.1 hypothetical protein SAV14893_077770 [Streptomyces avermitilis]GDY71244.1 hypothetical protein SAV31267_007290 [Streptomyces avermitilis]
MTPAATTIGDLPEKEFISSVLARFAETAERDKFEDCLVIELGGDASDRPVVVLNVDHPSYVRGEFRDLDDYRFYGRWVAAATCGDVISMGVRPAGFAVDLSAPLDLEVTKVEAIYEGLREVLDDYGARLSGGNVDANALEIVGIAWGVGRHDRLIRRGGAAVGDRILVTCDLGRGWAGHLVRRFGLRADVGPELAEGADRYHDRTRAPIEAILECAEAGYITSGMDLSDGPLEFCHTIAHRNGLGVVVDESALGTHPLVRRTAELLDVRPGLLALDPGYDFPYAHGYTVRSEHLDDAVAVFRRHDSAFTLLGTVVEDGGVQLARTAGDFVGLPEFWSDQTDHGDDRVQRWRDRVSAL